LFREPAPSFNEFLTKIAEMRDWSAEGGETEAQEDEKEFWDALTQAWEGKK